MNVQTHISLITLGHARHSAVQDLNTSRTKAERRNRKRALREIDRQVRHMIRNIANGRV